MALSGDRIKITNLRNNETVNYPMVLLKGTIEHYNCPESSKTNSLPHNQTNMELRPTRFKVLVELRPGDNIINIDFCCSTLKMRLTYKRRKSSLNIVPMYIINEGHCGKFQASPTEDNSPESACKRILTGCKLAQCLIAEKLYEEGLGRRTFQLENDECVIFRSNLHYKVARTITQEQLWTYLGREIMNSEIGSKDKKYLGFISCTKYNGDTKLIKTYEDMIKMTQGHIALGGGGLALFGSACLHTWPCNVDEVLSRFQDTTHVDKEKFMDDSCYRGTYGMCFTTTLGSALHELCHTFDLGHTTHGIMDRGFDNINKFFVMSDNRLCRKRIDNAIINSNGVIRNCVQENNYRRISEDDTYFTRSCSVILYHHKYFNDYPSQCGKYVLVFDSRTNFVRSTLGIRVIEIRKGLNEMVGKNWVFPGKILKYSFYIPKDCIDNYDIIFVEDNSGNILKETYKNK